jgi:uncharacterized RDD family membrane protein YckC
MVEWKALQTRTECARIGARLMMTILDRLIVAAMVLASLLAVTIRVTRADDIRVTTGERQPGVTFYDIGGSIWGGSQFVATRDGLYFNGRPRSQCVL